MRISKEVLKKISVEEQVTSLISLLNVQTGDVEEEIVTGKTYTIGYKGHRIHLTMSAAYEYVPAIKTRLDIKFDDISISALAAMFTVYKNIISEHQDDYKDLDLASLYRQRNEREAVREEIMKQEKKYEKKLMMDEIKRLAKENVESRRPPITAALPKPKMIMEE